jgi:hypothetical protein
LVSEWYIFYADGNPIPYRKFEGHFKSIEAMIEELKLRINITSMSVSLTDYVPVAS